MAEFNFIYTMLTIAVVLGTLMGAAGFLVYVERKVCAYMQMRLGPNRVGPAGLLQVLADGIKFILKEETLPARADKLLFLLAPAIGFTTAMLAFAVVPFGATTVVPPNPPAALETTDRAAFRRQEDVVSEKEGIYQTSYQFAVAPRIDIGILFIFAISSLTVYAVILGGWASNNKYSLIGGLRSSAQIISYEIPLGMSILGVVLMTGSLNLERILGLQASRGIMGWNIWFQPLAFLLFLISAFAECNRLPFDLPEAEQELVGGYHTEYNAMKLAFFLLGEYVHMMTTSFMMVILFFGGWHLPSIAGPESFWFLKLMVFAVKVTLFILFFMLIRWTIPRFRFDQLMGLAWKVMIPLSIANLLCVMIVLHMGWSVWWLLPASFVLLVGSGMLALLPETPAPVTIKQ